MARPHLPPLLDVALACGLTVLGVAQLLFEEAAPAAFVLLLAMTLPVMLRRSAPLVAVAVGWLALFVEGGLGEDVTSQGYAAILALWITVYSVARHGSGAQPLAGLVWAMACVVGSVTTTSGPDLPSLLLTTIITVTPWLAGNLIRREGARRARAEEVADLARLEAGQRATEAVAEERTRIAREVHDVLGHTLGLMVLQLGAADEAMDRDPVGAREAVRSARRAGKDALAEVRYLISLQDPVAEEQVAEEQVRPTRGLDDLPELVARNRRAGVDVDLELVVDPLEGGSWVPVPAAADLAAYRIVQEALTNAVRHGVGRVQVDVRRTGADTRIVVRNRMAGVCGDGSGRGLIGMTERARSCGGTLSADRVGDDFVVEALLPHGDSAPDLGR
ncbi:MAG: hypothetical protein GX555_04615, partial [Actinomycetales bacterium]|nr:hypothetical protein [Actinomycetales bacterium]